MRFLLRVIVQVYYENGLGTEGVKLFKDLERSYMTISTFCVQLA
jgi:hypothetical protein